MKIMRNKREKKKEGKEKQRNRERRVKEKAFCNIITGALK